MYVKMKKAEQFSKDCIYAFNSCLIKELFCKYSQGRVGNPGFPGYTGGQGQKVMHYTHHNAEQFKK